MTNEKASHAVRNLFLAMIVALGALVCAVWYFGDKAAQDVKDGEQTARVEQTKNLRLACARGVTRDFEARETNVDLATFATDASDAREAERNFAVAKKYRNVVARSKGREETIQERLPVNETKEAIKAHCEKQFPFPKAP